MGQAVHKQNLLGEAHVMSLPTSSLNQGPPGEKSGLVAGSNAQCRSGRG